MPVADVQLEHGHFRVANRLSEAILAARFGPAHLRILFALFRMTYGWRRSTVKCTETALARWAGMEPGPQTKRASGTFRLALRELVANNVVLRVDGMRGSPESTFSIQKDFTRWREFASAEDRLQSIYGVRPGSDDPALRSILRAEQQADEMAREQATSDDDETEPRPEQPREQHADESPEPLHIEDGPDTGHVPPSDVAHPQATPKTTWPAQGPTDGPHRGHGSGSNSLNGETYEAGKTGKTDIVSTGDIDLLQQQASFSAADVVETARVAAAAGAPASGESDPNPDPIPAPTEVPRLAREQTTTRALPGAREQAEEGEQPERRTEEVRPVAPSSAPTRALPTECATVAQTDRPEAAAVRAYAIGMSTAANAGIGYRWFNGPENPNPLTYVTGIATAEELLTAGVPLELARTTIVSVCHASKLPKPPSSLNYFRGAILEAAVAAEQRAYNAADPGRGGTRGGAPTSIAALVDPAKERRDQERREEDERAYQRALHAAAIAWWKDPANAPALAGITARVNANLEGHPESGWAKTVREEQLVAECAKAARFPDRATWHAERAAGKVGAT
jgi:phage replication O-like protein O